LPVYSRKITHSEHINVVSQPQGTEIHRAIPVRVRSIEKEEKIKGIDLSDATHSDSSTFTGDSAVEMDTKEAKGLLQ
jgi:hypothetical protein